jgi:sugar phosphate isomerase/epimerase
VSVDRRAFVQQLAGLAIASRFSGSMSRRWERLGIQLYTVRDLMQRDIDRTLAALATIGYADVELAGLYGASAVAMRQSLDRAGLAAPSSHVGLETLRANTARALDDAAALGQRYLVCPSIDLAERTVDGYKRAAADLNTIGERARRVGIQFAYHNHDFEFATVDGVVPYDLLLAECDSTLVQMELDIFWIVSGGRDPLAYFARYPGRFPMIHAKDMTRDGTMVDVGRGRIDFATILRHAGRAGLKHVFVEHDEPAAPLDDARASYQYLSRLTF